MEGNWEGREVRKEGEGVTGEVGNAIVLTMCCSCDELNFLFRLHIHEYIFGQVRFLG